MAKKTTEANEREKKPGRVACPHCGAPITSGPVRSVKLKIPKGSARNYYRCRACELGHCLVERPAT